jgi:hypothetical protein
MLRRREMYFKIHPNDGIILKLGASAVKKHYVGNL